MRPVRVSYPHFYPSFEPRPMRASDLWAVAEQARRQVCSHPRRPRIDTAAMMKRCAHVIAKGVELQVHIDVGKRIASSPDCRTLGMTEYDARWRGCVRIHLNGDVIGPQEELFRSTLAHELGHAVFDAPAWVQKTGQEELPQASFMHAAEKTAEGGIDWREWRANEFMGAFLVPRALLHGLLVKRAAARGLPLHAEASGLPILDAVRINEDVQSAFLFELAEIFGLSDSFIATRLRKYGLVKGSRPTPTIW